MWDNAAREGNLPFKHAHGDHPFIWGSPPTDDSLLPDVNGTPATYTPLGSFTLSVEKIGVTVTQVFPFAQRAATVRFSYNAAILSVDTIATIVNATADLNPGSIWGVFVGLDNGPIINVSQGTDIWDMIIAYGGTYVKRTGVAFANDIAPLAKLGKQFAIYVCGGGANVATSKIAVVATVRYTSLDQ